MISKGWVPLSLLAWKLSNLPSQSSVLVFNSPVIEPGFLRSVKNFYEYRGIDNCFLINGLP
jgi:hypothetical protein